MTARGSTDRRHPRPGPEASAGPLPRIVALGVLVLSLGLAGWFFDDLCRWFTRVPTAADVAGEWRFDAARAADLVRDLGESADGEVRKQKEIILASCEAYRDAVIVFTADAYAIRRPGTSRSTPCTYAGAPPNALTIRPQHGGADDALSLVLDRTSGILYLRTRQAVVPFRRGGEADAGRRPD